MKSIWLANCTTIQRGDIVHFIPSCFSKTILTTFHTEMCIIGLKNVLHCYQPTHISNIKSGSNLTVIQRLVFFCSSSCDLSPKLSSQSDRSLLTNWCWFNRLNLHWCSLSTASGFWLCPHPLGSVRITTKLATTRVGEIKLWIKTIIFDIVAKIPFTLKGNFKFPMFFQIKITIPEAEYSLPTGRHNNSRKLGNTGLSFEHPLSVVY